MNMYQYKNIIKDNCNKIITFITNKAHITTHFYMVKLLIEHLSYAKEPALAEALKILLEKKDESFMPTLKLLMEKNQGISILSEQKLIGYEYRSGWMYNSIEKNEVSTDRWSMLVAGMLNHFPHEMAKLIVKYFPNYLAKTLAGLSEIQEKAKKISETNDEHRYKAEDIAMRRLALLLQITADSGYQASSKDKRDLQTYFTDKITNAKSKTEFNEVTEKYNKCHLLRQHRYPTADKIYEFFFNKPKEVSATNMLSKALDAKAVAINNL
jgi:hypothetical protein